MDNDNITIGITLSEDAGFIEIGKKSGALAEIAGILEERKVVPDELNFNNPEEVSYTCKSTFSRLDIQGLMKSIPASYHQESFIR